MAKIQGKQVENIFDASIATAGSATGCLILYYI